jgi:hypothetical protein
VCGPSLGGLAYLSLICFLVQGTNNYFFEKKIKIDVVSYAFTHKLATIMMTEKSSLSFIPRKIDIFTYFDLKIPIKSLIGA